MEPMIKRLSFAALAVSVLFGCGGGGSSPSGPSTPVPAPTPTVGSLAGTVTQNGGGAVAGATVTVLDGANAGRAATTNGSGQYRLDNLTSGNANVAAAANGLETRSGVQVAGETTLNLSLPYTRSGSGNTVFDMPTNIRRVRIFGRWNGTGTSNFIVRIGGSLTVNEILRTTGTYEGIHSTTGGVVEITNSSAITWSFTQVQ